MSNDKAAREKDILRKQMLKKREQLTESKVAEKSQQIISRLQELSDYKQANTVMVFVSIRNEVRTEALIRSTMRRGQSVIVPVTDMDHKRLIPSRLKDYDRELAPGTYGVMEPREEFIRPVPHEEIDIVITPGAVFDIRGHRIGYGGGFYDRLLAGTRRDTPAVAVAYEFQVLTSIEHVTTPNDIPVDKIVTELRVISTDRCHT